MRITALYMMKLGEVVTTIPTIGFNVETVEWKSTKVGRIAFTAWDVSSAAQYWIPGTWLGSNMNPHAYVFIVMPHACMLAWTCGTSS